jgi:fibronectin-binding autotransporter adhesin
MPTYYARKAGNINAADVWATTPSGTASAVTFVSGDVLISNSFAITINVDTNLGSSGQIRNDNTGGATAGGSFTLNSGIRLDANVFAGPVACINHSGTGATVVGNITGGSANAAHGLNLTHNSGTVTITGNITGGTANNALGVMNIGTGNVSITGNCVAQSGTAANNNNTGIMTISGNATGGSIALPCMGVSNAGNGTLTLTGNVTAGTGSGSQGARNYGTNVLTVTGIATAGNLAPGILNDSTGRINVGRAVGNAFGVGNTAGLTSNAGVANASTGIVEFSELEYGSLGQSATSGTGFRLKKQSSNAVTFNLCDTAGAKTLVDATQGQMPAISNVRLGVSYASGALTGTCAVPSPATVATGVPVDNTVGTAALSASDVAAAVWGAATRSITGGTVDTLTNSPDVPTEAEIASAVWGAATKEITGGTVTTLTNAPTVPSAAAIASQVRTELSVELGRVDQAISSRLAGSAYTAPANSDIAAVKAKTDLLPASPAATGDIPSANISAIKAKTDLLETTRLAQCSTVATTGAQLAAALS